MKRLAVTLAALVGVILGLGGVASANAYPPGGPSVTASPSTAGPGESITVTAKCAVGESVTITLETSSVTAPCETDEIQPASVGTATGILAAPTAAGTYNGSVNGTVSGPLGTFTITVQAAGTPPTGGLPSTGSDGTSTMTILAAGLLTVGLVLFALATLRRRRLSVAP